MTRLQATAWIVLAELPVWTSGASPRPLLGAQRWDMYSGDIKWTGQQELGFVAGGQGFLAPLEWHHRAPFFCRPQPANRSGPLIFNYPFDPGVLQAAMDAEIKFAFGAGLDFWIFNTPARTLVGGSPAEGTGAWDLHNNLDAYLNHKGDQKPNFVTALFGFTALNYSRTRVDTMMDEIVTYMQLPHWQMVLDQRPLLPVLFPRQFETNLINQTSPAERMSLAQFVVHLRHRTVAAGLRNPYIVAESASNCPADAAHYKAAGFDAMSDYQAGYGGAMCERGACPSYQQATEALLHEYRTAFDAAAQETNISYVPPMDNQMYQFPRATGNVTWAFELPEPGDVATKVKRVFDLVVERKATHCEAQVVFMYSWNEMSEGGGLCPTMGMDADHTPVTAQLEEVREVLHNYVSQD